jgi:Rho family protein
MSLTALKCDLRDDRAVNERLSRYGKSTVQYEEGLEVARRIRASRYLGAYELPHRAHLILIAFSYSLAVDPSLECSAKHNRGVNEVFVEAARVSISTKPHGGSHEDGGCVVM